MGGSVTARRRCGKAADNWQSGAARRTLWVHKLPPGNRPMIRTRATVAALALLLAGGCQDDDAPAADANAIELPEGRIAAAPTPPDSLPPAILGTALPPRGVPVRYFDGDSAATGYLALP